MKSVSDRDTACHLVIRGQLDDRDGSLFEGMQMERAGDTTVLVGRIRDGAQLFGLIERIEALGLEFVSVQQAGEPDEQDRNEA